MKHLLILAYDFPPYISVGGLRPYNWFKYLKEYGVEPVVITRQWSNNYGNGLDYVAPGSEKKTRVEHSSYGTILYTPYRPTWSNRLLLKHGKNKYKLLRKTLTAFGEIKQFLWIAGPKRELYREAKRYMKTNPVDVIITTADPFVLFFYAKKLSREFNVPWIADYRDPWSQDKDFQINRLFYVWNKKLEKKIVSTSSSIITVSEFIEHKLHEYFPSRNVHILPNGYDPEVIDTIAELPQSTNRLTISFVGTIYEWHPWKSFLDVFSDFAEEKGAGQVQLNFYGINNPSEVQEYLKRLPVVTQESVGIFPKMPNMDLLQRLAGENVMLLFNYYSFMGTKIFDYIGTKRKILLCYANDEQALKLKEEHYTISEVEGMSKQLQVDLIRETNSGVIADNAIHLKQLLNDLHREFSEKGKIECHSTGVENYSRKIQVKKLAEIVKDL